MKKFAQMRSFQIAVEIAPPVSLPVAEINKPLTMFCSEYRHVAGEKRIRAGNQREQKWAPSSNFRRMRHRGAGSSRQMALHAMAWLPW
jgi:hypothetical protein